MATKSKYPGVTPHKGAWQYRIKVKLDDGTVVDTIKRLDENGNPFLKARDAYEAKLSHIEQLRNPVLETVSEPSVTPLRDIYNSYMITEANTKAAATLRKQDSMWKNHVEPAFGNKDINSFVPLDLSMFLSKLYERHTYSYVQGFLRYFYLLFGHADRMGLIDPSVYNRLFVQKNTRLKMPAKKQSDYQDELDGAIVYDDYQIYMLNQLFNEDNNLRLAYMLGLYCGLRISETFGLRWSNIDFANRTIKIDRQLHYNNYELRLSPVKTLNSVRIIPISSYLFEDLWLTYQKQIRDKNEMGFKYQDTERVYDEVTNTYIVGGDFVNRKPCGELLTTNSFKYWSKKIKQDLDINFQYHNLRHTFATRCAMNNMPFGALQSVLGHKKLETTMKYYINPNSQLADEKKRACLNSMYDLKPYGDIDIK